jgi:hypothetical protein
MYFVNYAVSKHTSYILQVHVLFVPHAHLKADWCKRQFVSLDQTASSNNVLWFSAGNWYHLTQAVISKGAPAKTVFMNVCVASHLEFPTEYIVEGRGASAGMLKP